MAYESEGRIVRPAACRRLPEWQQGLRRDPFPSECGSLPVGRGNCQRDELICSRRHGNRAPPGRERSRLDAGKRFPRITVASVATTPALVCSCDHALSTLARSVTELLMAKEWLGTTTLRTSRRSSCSRRELHRFVCT